MAGALLATVHASTPAPPYERLVRVYGELATADRVAIIVPGADTTARTFERGTHRPGGAARALLAQVRQLAPGTKVAVVAWLGYDAPATFSLDVLTDAAALEGARELRRTVARLGTRAPVTLLCHSYGSVVCAHASPGLPVAEVAVFGSPGLGTDPRPGFWVGRGAADWVAEVPHTKVGPLGFGADPMIGAARTFATGPGGHSDYFKPGTASLRNLALITLGRTGEVSPG